MSWQDLKKYDIPVEFINDIISSEVNYELFASSVNVDDAMNYLVGKLRKRNITLIDDLTRLEMKAYANNIINQRTIGKNFISIFDFIYIYKNQIDISYG